MQVIFSPLFFQAKIGGGRDGSRVFVPKKIKQFDGWWGNPTTDVAYRGGRQKHHARFLDGGSRL